MNNNYLVGSYIYSIYKEKTRGFEITGDFDTFCFVLGWHIQQTFPEAYEYLVLNNI